MTAARSRWRGLLQHKAFWIVTVCTILMATAVGNSYYRSVLDPRHNFIPYDSAATVGSGQKEVSARQYEGDWPFPFQTATVQCQPRTFGSIRRPVVTMVGSGRRYALNGVARGLGEFADHKQLLKTDPITGAFLKGPRSIGDLIAAGVALCE